MNDLRFEAALRSALPPADPSPCLDAKIDRALGRHRVKRRVLLSFAATAALAFGFAALPAVQAQATLGGFARALDHATRVRVSTFNLDADGSRHPASTTTIVNGDTAFTDALGYEIIDVRTEEYNLDPGLGAYVVTARAHPAHSLRLADLIGPGGEFSLGRRVSVERLTVDGREIVRATVTDLRLPERTILDADAATQLPIRAFNETFERGEWRRAQEVEFDYAPSLAAVRPDLKRFPLLTPDQAAHALEAAMTKTTLASLPLKNGRLLIHAVDVARDGTVFVSLRSGNRGTSYIGTALKLSDDLGTDYAHRSECFFKQSASPDGRFEAEVFTPRTPLPFGHARTLTLSSHRFADGRLARLQLGGFRSSDGRWHTTWDQFNSLPLGKRPIPANLLTLTFSAPTCDFAPVWARRLDYSFGYPLGAAREIAAIRSRAALTEERWPEAEAQLNEELRLRHEDNRQGTGSWGFDDVQADLDKVRAAMRP